MKSLHTLTNWPAQDDRPWNFGILLGTVCLFCAGTAMLFMPRWICLVFIGGSASLVITCTFLIAAQEFWRIRSYREYLLQCSYTALTTAVLYQKADRRSQELMLGVLRKKEEYATCQ